jgi:hypothetical protein
MLLLASTAAGDTQLLSLRVLIGTVMAMTVAMFGAKAFIDAKVLQPALKSVDGAATAATAAAAGAKPAGKKKKKSKGSFGEGIEVLKKSPKIRNLALLVMSYGVGHRCGFKTCHLVQDPLPTSMLNLLLVCCCCSLLCCSRSACTCITCCADCYLAAHP